MKHCYALLLPILISLIVPLHVMAENPGYAFFEDFVDVAAWFVLIAVVALLVGLAAWRDTQRAGVFAAGMTLLLTANMLFRLPLLWLGLSAEETQRLLVQVPLHIGWTVLLAYIVTRVDNLGSIVQGTLLAVAVFLSYDAGRMILAGQAVDYRDESPLQVTLPAAGEGTARSIATDTIRSRPDIFVIVLDGYGRQDVLRELYGVDNSEFIDFLRENGFFVADRSCANYSQTPLALFTLLGMRYVDTVRLSGMDGARIRHVFRSRLLSETVPTALRSVGYRRFVDQTWCDLFDQSVEGYEVLASNEFPVYRNIVLRLTGKSLLDKLRRIAGQDEVLSEGQRLRDRMLRQMGQVHLYAAFDSPVFVFMHILSPHPPFLFGSINSRHLDETSFSFGDGSHYKNNSGASTEEYRVEYAAQVEALTVHVRRMIARIVAAEPGAIVVLLSDHGPGSELDFESLENTRLEERFPILHAIRVPGADSTLFYSGITPVNTFRRIFHHLFAADSTTLPDRSYYTTWNDMFPFIDVTEAVRREPLFK
ncbi:MAG: sulfatase-like hydrolase/transferase [Bacteroidota bacterium]|nr:sulfatase-like hydrolase/transferase [Bacteroidota bacterium]